MMAVPQDQPIKIEFGHPATRQDMINSRLYVLDCNIGSDDGWIFSGRLFHFRWARGTTVTPQIDKIDIVAMLCDVIHPRETIQRQIECT